MKTSRFFLHHPISAAFVFLLSIGSILPATHAQTFTGQAKLADSPATGFQAIVSPVANRLATIRINFDNEARGSVRIQIRDQQGKAFYDEFESAVYYRHYFDLSSMPTGTYTVCLSKPYAVYSQTFRIESPTASRIVLLNEPPVDASLSSGKQMASH